MNLYVFVVTLRFLLPSLRCSIPRQRFGKNLNHCREWASGTRYTVQLLAMYGIIRKAHMGKNSERDNIKFYKVMAVPVLLYESEVCAVTRDGESRIQSAGVEFSKTLITMHSGGQTSR